MFLLKYCNIGFNLSSDLRHRTACVQSLSPLVLICMRIFLSPDSIDQILSPVPSPHWVTCVHFAHFITNKWMSAQTTKLVLGGPNDERSPEARSHSLQPHVLCNVILPSPDPNLSICVHQAFLIASWRLIGTINAINIVVSTSAHEILLFPASISPQLLSMFPTKLSYHGLLSPRFPQGISG